MNIPIVEAEWSETGVKMRAADTLYTMPGRVTDVRIVGYRCRDFQGQVLNMALYFALGCFFFYAVLDLGWQWRVWVAVGFFLIGGLLAVNDIFLANRVSYYRVEMRIDGERYGWTTDTVARAHTFASQMRNRG
ncbi:MAG: hypothetical protein AAFV26_01895 [Pseudomonadota bacterium]